MDARHPVTSLATDLKRSPLDAQHHALHARMGAFGGWWLPIQYRGIIAEHTAVRRGVGLCDVSHLGELEVTGPGALDFLREVLPRDVAGLQDGQAFHTPLCEATGGMLDDLVVYRLREDRFWLVVNAANVTGDVAWLAGHRGSRAVTLRDISAETACLALQGPGAARVLQPDVPIPLASLGTYHCVESRVAGCPALVGRTGYTGEDGFEVYLSWADAPSVWARWLAGGAAGSVEPVGLGARDTLRLEAGLPLYGHELTRDTSPWEAGLGHTVDLDDRAFVARAALARLQAAPRPRVLVALAMEDGAIPRAGQEILQGGQVVGVVTSGAYAPTLKRGIALAYVDRAEAAPGTTVEVRIRETRHPAQVRRKPLYRRGQRA